MQTLVYGYIGALPVDGAGRLAARFAPEPLKPGGMIDFIEEKGI